MRACRSFLPVSGDCRSGVWVGAPVVVCATNGIVNLFGGVELSDHVLSMVEVGWSVPAAVVQAAMVSPVTSFQVVKWTPISRRYSVALSR
jgi:hypothetical protein